MSGLNSQSSAKAKSAVQQFAEQYKHNRNVSLDVLRGVAILLVLCHHNPNDIQTAGWLEPIGSRLMTIGWTGVDLFFVLSGFLVAGILFKELIRHDSLNVKRFILRRGFKIWPGYYFYLVFAAICLLKVNQSPQQIFAGLMPNLIHLQNYFPFTMVLTFTWSLAVEEHFYLLLPIVLALLHRLSRNRYDYRPWIGVLCLAVIIICPTWRFIDYCQNPHAHPFRLMATHLRADGLALGSLMAFAYQFHNDKFIVLLQRRWAWLLAALLMLSPFLYVRLEDSCLLYTLGPSLIVFGYACLLMASLNVQPYNEKLSKLYRLVPFRCIAFIGFYSYSIYLWHYTCRELPYQFVILITWLPEWSKWLLQSILYGLSATLFGFLAARAVEFPALALREKLSLTREAPKEELPVEPPPS
jgi:peptidoglycan/LPS O-acetylase OafA/YrhL